MSGGRAPHRAARRSPARAATGLYFGRATDTAGADLWCEFRHEARFTADGDGACVARTRRRSATCRRGGVQHRARHTYTSSARVRLRSVRADAPMHAPSAVRTAGAVLSARNNSVSARGARGRGRGARTRGGGWHCVGMARPHPRRTQTTEIFSGLGHQPEGHLSAAVQPRPRPGAPTEHPNVSAAPSGRAPRKHPGVSVVRGGSGLATAEAAVARTRPAWAPVGAEPFPAPRAARGALWRPGTAQVWRWRGRQG
jgi:hypothetical protein